MNMIYTRENHLRTLKTMLKKADRALKAAMAEKRDRVIDGLPTYEWTITVNKARKEYEAIKWALYQAGVE